MMYEEPKSFALKDESQQRVDRKVLPALDVERLRAEDRERGKNPQHPGPMRFAVSADVTYALGSSGTWQTLPDGRLWRLRIQSPGAKSMNLGFTRYEMPEGAKLWVYDPGHTDVEGPYTSRHRSELGSLWTPVIQGDEIVIELFVPTGAREPVLEIGKVNQGYRSLEKAGIFGTSEGTCENDVVCSVGDPWRKQIRAVGLYTVSGMFACTGNLVNNTAVNGTPYILSANHCTVSSANAATIVYYWNFQSATCGTHGPGSLAQNQTGAIYRASYAPSDFVLFELSAKPDPLFNVYYAGWDATGAPPPGDVGIHQPSADVKAISFSNSPPQGADWTGTGDGGTLDATGNHWRVDWNSGVTEEGSSGSCIFETNTGRCIGQLHGGPSACGVASTSLHDYYGKLSASWTGGGTSASRLMDWLDPGSTGALSMDGDPHIKTANGVHYDFQGAGEYVALRDPHAELEVQTRQAPVATTFTPGPDAHDGLATCVSLNTAVAARVGKHRVTYEPNLSGVPDPRGLQLRVDGRLTSLTAAGHDLGSGARLAQTTAPGGLEIDFADASVLYVTPGWWASQGKWYLDVDLVRAAATDGADPGVAPAGGIMGAIAPDAWLPALPDGASMGPMPGTLHQRYEDLYRKFGDAWRVTEKSSLFDYSPGTSTNTFTLRSWPAETPPCELPHSTPARPATQQVAEEACRVIADENARRSCVFDVRITGHTGFARTYEASERIVHGGTRVTVVDDKEPSRYREPVIFTATVTRDSRIASGAPSGRVRFTLDGHAHKDTIRLDRNGQASWKTSALAPGRHEISARYLPSEESANQPSSSPNHLHVVEEEKR
jgi:hypothetical protein